MNSRAARRAAPVSPAPRSTPKLVIADEPTAGLDVSIQGEILNLMTRLKDEFALSYVIVTHNLAMIRHVSDRLAIMYLGRIVEEGPTAEIFAKARHPYTASLIVGLISVGSAGRFTVCSFGHSGNDPLQPLRIASGHAEF